MGEPLGANMQLDLGSLLGPAASLPVRQLSLTRGGLLPGWGRPLST